MSGAIRWRRWVLVGVLVIAVAAMAGRHWLSGHGVAADSWVLLDLDGNVLSRFNWREKLGLIEPADVNYISSGPYAGSFAVTEYSPGTVTIFSLDSLSNQ